jgi:hypothetical protein
VPLKTNSRDTTKSRVRVLVAQIEKGFLPYTKCFEEELRHFAASRGFSDTRPHESAKDKLIAKLERADRAITFPRFLDLPPELRERIYAFHFRWLDQLPERFHQPPICHLSRLVRIESLPLFYENAIFQLHLHRDTNNHFGRRRKANRHGHFSNTSSSIPEYNLAPTLETLLAATPAELFPRITHLDIALPPARVRSQSSTLAYRPQSPLSPSPAAVRN